MLVLAKSNIAQTLYAALSLTLTEAYGRFALTSW